jgi:hypothetical protein
MSLSKAKSGLAKKWSRKSMRGLDCADFGFETGLFGDCKISSYHWYGTHNIHHIRAPVNNSQIRGARD